MKSKIFQLAASVLVLSAMSASATIRYVDVNNTGPIPPYTNWTTAATTIQDAVDAALAGDQIRVNNGVYQTGGRVVFGILTNRVVVDKAVTVQSVNGAAVTVIRGFQVPGTTNGASAIRCVYLTNGAALVGFTLTNGATRSLGDGDYARDQSGGGVWCESLDAVVSNCVLTGNSAGYDGGGANGGTLNNCNLAANSAYSEGGGAYLGTLNNCTLNGNSSSSNGGGASSCILNNCTLAANSAYSEGGGASVSTLNNCTLTGNSADYVGGGAAWCTVNNCIVYYNRARIRDDNYTESTLNYSCTIPLPTGGVSNISAEPQLADLSHVSNGSPCREAGSAAYAVGLDFDGETWANPPSIGCDEYRPGSVMGPLSVSVQSAFTNVAVGFTVSFTATWDGRASANRWEFGDGTVVSNQPYTSHSWGMAGDYSVIFHASNDANPDGVSATVTVHIVPRPIHYVALNSSNSLAPYTSWATAASNIQDAVDAASSPGALVIVSNGVYQTGGRATLGATNRVAVNKPVTLQSVNGAAVTLIQGDQGDQVMQCVYLANGAALVGFTLTNGVGGVECESPGAIVSKCVLTGNRAPPGIDGWPLGGGAKGGTLNNCMLTGNSALFGGGADGCTLNNCTLTGNSAFYGGGGAHSCMLNNCTLNGNSSSSAGGGAHSCTLNNCTLTGNSAYNGGGACECTLNNCILYYNSAPSGENNYSDSFLSYSCTTPLPPDGVGNISAEPQLADLSHLSSGSPCRGAGSATFVTGVDIDGETWANPPSIGCDEYHPAAVTGPLNVSIQAVYTNAAVEFAVNFVAAINGSAAATRWDFGDGTVVNNQQYASHRWGAAGDYKVVFQANNGTYPGGVSATVIVRVVAQPVLYVALGSGNPVAPYASWATAANNIQDAVDAASVAGSLVLVTNGVYQTGGLWLSDSGSNRVAVTKPLVLRSVNGAASTVIHGYRNPNWNLTEDDIVRYDGSDVRCVYLCDGAALVGFTLTNGSATYGGGVSCETTGTVVSNCVLTGNSANYGGGAARATLNNCLLNGNSANYGGGGGGASDCVLNNCTVTGNSAHHGGGVYGCTGNNCIVYYNSARSKDDNCSESFLSYSCTTPLPTNQHHPGTHREYGVANLTYAPLFLDQAGGNLRLQSNSPCINAGSNPSAAPGPDLDGNPRIIGGTVDIGAYEFQSPRSLISYAWLQQYGLALDGTADFADTDRDGMNNWQEWRARTDPTNALSMLRLLSPSATSTKITLTWESVTGVSYFLERSGKVDASPTSFAKVATRLTGQAGTTSFIDTNAVGPGPFFYRVGAQE